MLFVVWVCWFVGLGLWGSLVGDGVFHDVLIMLRGYSMVDGGLEFMDSMVREVAWGYDVFYI
ncbi:hypothetical protein [Vulcanisaeta distributa]|uniref:Uncharacterized protein n=1 Tax=Vulcanisaeta distributa (strain DSM 14429 / JCM 11212 / NBRC 100878 / IC-017) TaxID=572478 RepID=E1QNS4_VULDI|nr:hypothetical protein [Vulcanisaeta distributa]ADN50170.1 hypothetical protein Vdis_0778 [Vulcanisaeta distributa DSM 14429]